MYPLVGREHMLSVLISYMNATLRGAGGCIVLEGPIGIGRTRMLKAAAQEGAELGLTVGYMRTGAIDQPTPVSELITFLRHAMAGAPQFEDMVRPDINPFSLADRLGELIKDAARRRPLLIVLDDAQRADEISALALQSLVQSLASSPVLWLLARRPVPAQSLAQHAVGWLIDRSAVQLHLGPLDDAAVATLCAGVLGAKPDSSVLRLAARCGGNPWLLENLLGALLEAGQVIIADGTASALADRLPEGVLAEVDRLLDELPPGVRRLLVRGRSIGRTFSVEEAAITLGESPLDLSSGVDEAVQAGLIQRNGVKLTFVHDVFGEILQRIAFRESVPASPVPATDARVHRSDRVSEVDDQPVRTEPAVNGRGGSPEPSACDCDAITAQAISAVRSLSEGASRTLTRAFALLAGAGRGAEAGRLAHIAAHAGIDAPDEARMVLDLAQGLRDAGCHDLLVEHLRRTLARRDLSRSDRVNLEKLLADTAQRVNGVSPSGAPIGNGRSISLSRPLTAPRCVGSRGEMRANGRRVSVVASPQAPGRPSGKVCERPLWTWMVRALVAADQFEEATAVCAAIKQECEKLGEAWAEPLWHAHRAELLVTAGRLDEARAAAETGLRLTDRSAPEEAVPARVVLARISLHHGDSASASEHLRMAERLMTGEVTADKIGLDWALAQFHAACGRPSMAVQTLINVEDKVNPDRLLFAEAPIAAATLVRLAKKAGLSAEAERAAGFARCLTERNPAVASLAGGAEHAEGLLRHDPTALRRAVEHYEVSGRPLATGVALEDAAQEEHSMQNRAQAVRFLGSALDLYVNCGARQDVNRVQRKLRRLGVNNVRALGADRPTSGWESLTGAELRVVRAIVDGRTNKEAASMLFLSPHTVDSHLRRVFAKLNINSRVELTKHFITHEAS